ncbi:MAG: GNAT family N-acetyltransferase [Vicinamibacterales bacterium]
MVARPTGLDWRAGLPELRAPGLVLREPRRTDASSLFELLTNEAVARYMSAPPPTAEAFDRFIIWVQGERRAGRFFCYAIVPDGVDEAVGLIQVRALGGGLGTLEWGFALGPPYWGSGLFLPSAQLVVDFSFRHVGAHRLEARAAVANGRGNRVLVKLGASCEGRLRDSLRQSETTTDQHLWSILAHEWLARHGRPFSPNLVATERPPEEPVVPAPTDSLVSQASGWRAGLPEVAGVRWCVREVAASDAPALQRWLSDPQVYRYLAPPPSTVQEFERFITWARVQRAAGRFACFSVVDAAKGEAVGVFQVRALESDFRSAEWGFALGAPFWGTGCFTDASRVVLAFAFDELRVHRLEARAAAANGRAVGALAKLHHRCEGRLRSSFLVDNRFVDDSLWALLAPEYRAKMGDGGQVLP